MYDVANVSRVAESYAENMYRFLRDLIKIPGEGQHEKRVINRVCDEMRQLNFDNVWIDTLGNALGSIGKGSKVIAFDGHVDTVGTGELENWSFDPFEGFEDEIWIGGRGASDQRGGIVSAVYGARIMKDLGLIPEEYRILVVGSVQEEECEGLSWQCIIEEEQIRPELVVLTEPTDGNVYRGHRGRMDIIIEIKGLSAHGSTPEKGVNAISRMAEVIRELEDLNQQLRTDEFLGKGTLAVTQIFYKGASRCAIPDECSISIDRRLTLGESERSALRELMFLPSIQKYQAKIYTDHYARPSWRGHIHETGCYFPAWMLPEDSPVCRAAVTAASEVSDPEQMPKVDKWIFSTNGVKVLDNGIIRS